FKVNPVHGVWFENSLLTALPEGSAPRFSCSVVKHLHEDCFLWLEATALAPWLAMSRLMQGLGGQGEGVVELGPSLGVWLISSGFLLILPALWLMVLVLRSSLRRLPVTRGIVEGMPQTVLPIAAALCLAYALFLPRVAVGERQLKQELREMAISETAYQARLAAQSQR
uniref:hypothetical protein n=1 Tax=Armatimonas sp. TaxID=1872638 RepID=UPI00286CAE34